MKIGYATRLQGILSDISSDVVGRTHSSSLEELKKFLDILPISSSIAAGGISVSDRGKLDAQGTALWNACARLMRRVEGYVQEEEEGFVEKRKDKERERESIFLCHGEIDISFRYRTGECEKSLRGVIWNSENFRLFATRERIWG